MAHKRNATFWCRHRVEGLSCTLSVPGEGEGKGEGRMWLCSMRLWRASSSCKFGAGYSQLCYHGPPSASASQNCLKPAAPWLVGTFCTGELFGGGRKLRTSHISAAGLRLSFGCSRIRALSSRCLKETSSLLPEVDSYLDHSSFSNICVWVVCKYIYKYIYTYIHTHSYIP